MAQFKIGDRVRVNRPDEYWNGVTGVVCSVDEKYVHFHEDADARFRNGDKVYFAEGGHGFRPNSLDLLSTPTPDERAVALVKAMTSDKFKHVQVGSGYGNTIAECFVEARAIVAALEPVDEDIEEARQLAALGVEPFDGSAKLKLDIMTGKEDHIQLVQVAFASLKRGRQLEKEGK